MSLAQTTFTMSPEEVAICERWIAEHEKTCSIDFSRDVVASRYTFSFTPNSVATSVMISCPCGAEEDVSDVDSW